MATKTAQNLVSLPDAARRLCLHRATVNEMVRAGRIPARRVGPHWYIAATDLDAFAAAYERPRNAPRRPPRQPSPDIEILERLLEWNTATVAELAQVVEMSEGNIRKHLCIAEAQCLATRDEYGNWSLTDSGVDDTKRRSL